MINEQEVILSNEDLLNMLDSLLREEAPWWDHFYSDRHQKVPFFVPSPDENLVQYFEQRMLHSGRVLELGCGPGRNAIYLAGQGCQFDAVDLSQEAIQWGIERASEAHVSEAIQFTCANLFNMNFTPDSYDLVYDSGCFHHIPPHRRMNYVQLIWKALKPSGHFGLTCFAMGDQACGELSDWEVYRQRSLRGGLAFTESTLQAIFHDLTLVQLRKMIPYKQPAPVFGVPFLWTALFRKSSLPPAFL